MIRTSRSLRALINEFRRLPGIGEKSAYRLAFHVLKNPREDAVRLARALVEVKDRVKNCSICFNITEEDPCAICADTGRDRRMLCVVEEPGDLMAVEKTNEFKGMYHVLGGVLSPLDGIGPERLTIKELLARLGDDVREVIIATNPSVEGEATALYLARLIKPLGIAVTRIAHGIPVGGDIELADQSTMARALEGRKEF
ncbi:recombination protein RecR [bacterium]|nr:recombination protein RecR [candidate division CSSED10-310 bacterium]